MRTLFSILIAAFAMSVHAADHVIDSSKHPLYLIVQTAKSGSFDGNTLTLNEIPLVIYFADTPGKISGHTNLKKFMDSWNKGKNSFQKDPPNATLSIYDEKGANNVVVEIKDPKVEGNTVKYKVRVIDGKIPKSFGASSLFIDNVIGMY